MVIWFNNQWQTFWTFRLEQGYFIQDFYLGFFSQERRDQISRIFFKLFLSELAANPESSLGMFVDKNGNTYEYNFADFFLDQSGNEVIDYVTDLVCVYKERLEKVEIEPGFGVKELDNGFVCVTRSAKFLDYLFE